MKTYYIMENNKGKNIRMYYHTSLRNIGLYTSISLALLGYSRVYRDKNNLYNLIILFAAIIINLVALLINLYLTRDLKSYLRKMKKRDETEFQQWLNLLKIILCVNISLLFLSSFTGFKELKKILF